MVEPPTGHSTSAAPLALHLGRQLKLDLGRHRAHFDQQLAFDVARQQAIRPIIDRVDRRAVGENGERDVDRAGEFGRGLGDGRAGVGQRLALVRTAIPNRDLMADLDQPRRDIGAHRAKARYSDMHVSSRDHFIGSFAGNDRRSQPRMKDI